MSDPNLAKHLFAGGSSKSATAEPGMPSTAEGLRLFKAFTGIEDASLRHSIIHLVELLGATTVAKR